MCSGAKSGSHGNDLNIIWDQNPYKPFMCPHSTITPRLRQRFQCLNLAGIQPDHTQPTKAHSQRKWSQHLWGADEPHSHCSMFKLTALRKQSNILLVKYIMEYDIWTHIENKLSLRNPKFIISINISKTGVHNAKKNNPGTDQRHGISCGESTKVKIIESRLIVIRNGDSWNVEILGKVNEYVLKIWVSLGCQRYNKICILGIL